jgi:hypothetical protein
LPTLSPNAAFEYQRDDPGRPPAARDPLVLLLGIGHLFRALWSFVQENRPIFTYSTSRPRPIRASPCLGRRCR